MFYNYEAGRIRDIKYEELKSIAKLKIDQIVEWYQDELSDAGTLSRNTVLIANINKWLGTESEIVKSDLLSEISALKEEHNYKDILLVNPDGKIIFSINSFEKNVDKILLDVLKKSIVNSEVTSSDLYLNKLKSEIEICFVAPLYNLQKIHAAALVFIIDPQKYLYPFIQSWPSSSKTAETLLVRKENNQVLMLNNLRHRKNSALRERFGLENRKLPAANAVLGVKGIFEGIDYRGAEVIAHLNPIHGTNWFMVSKVDKTEVLSELNFRTVVIAGFVLLLILLSGSGLAMVYNSRQKNIYKELYNTEKELWESQEEFKTTLYSIGDGVITTDVNGRIKQMNHEAERLTGWSENEAEGVELEKVFVIINEKTRTSVENPVNRVLKEGIVVGLANHTILISKDTSERPIADSGAPIKNKDGEITGVVLVFKDQTKEYISQRALEESEARLRLALQSAGQSIFEYDITNNELRFTSEYQKILGFENEALTEDATEWIGKIHPEDRDIMRKVYFDYIEDKLEEFSVEFRQKNIHGEWLWILSKGKIISKDKNGIPQRLLGTLIDITALKNIEKQLIEAKEKAENSEKIKTEFLAQMSHEIRSPINVILSYVDLIRNNIFDQINKELLPGFESITTAGKRIIRTIDLILNMSDLQLGTYEVYKKEFNLKSLIHSLLKEYATAAAKKNIQLNLIEKTNNTLLTNDDYAVGQIFANLIDNAIKYTNKGSVDISILRDSDKKLIVSVSDTGIGISNEYMPKIFTPFSQEENGYSRSYDGTGLGLALIKKYCEIIGANITVESEKGKGTRFTVFLESIE